MDSGCNLADPGIFTERDDRDGLPVRCFVPVKVSCPATDEVLGWAVMNVLDGTIGAVYNDLMAAVDAAKDASEDARGA